MQVIIFGCGDLGKAAYNFLHKDNIFCFCDNDETKQDASFLGKKVISPKRLVDYATTYKILICIKGIGGWSVAQQLRNMGIENYFVYSTVCYDKNVMAMDAQSFLKLFLEDTQEAKDFQKIYWNMKKQSEQDMRFMQSIVDIRNIKPTKGYRRKRQHEEIVFCKDVFSLIENLHIKPILDYGNLLGYIRHHGFIPWDVDLDFSLLRSDYEKLASFCRDNMVFATYEGNDEANKINRWKNLVYCQNQNKFIFISYSTHLEICRGTSLLDANHIDFFVLDYFDNELPFAEYHKKLREITLKDLDSVEESARRKYYIKIKNKYPYTKNKSRNIFFGMENRVGNLYALRNNNKEWLHTEDFFPLDEITYENLPVYIPHNPQRILNCEYGEYNNWPTDISDNCRDDMTDFGNELFIKVEFYLIDAFEIAHFAPFYEFLRAHGVFATFVAEPVDINSSSTWFDYNIAVKELDKRGFEYHTSLNSNADIAFSTQVCRILAKYSKETIKINLNYGVTLLKDNFYTSLDNIKGYDYKFVYGDFYKQICEQSMPNECVKIIGYPKYYDFSLKKNLQEKEQNISELKLSTNKKIICYLPTWDEYSSITTYAKQIAQLRDEYYIITKPHHCTWRLQEKSEELAKLKEISDIVLPPTYPMYKIASVADLVLVDAKSGATVELAYLNPTMGMIWIIVSATRDDFYPEIDSMAEVINHPLELTTELVTDVLNNCKKKKYREDHIAQYISKKPNLMKKAFFEILKYDARIAETKKDNVMKYL